VKKSQFTILGIILISLFIGIYFYPQMPEEMAFHWNLEGQVDGYVSKFFGLLFEPLLSIGLFLLFLAIPRIDPLKWNIEKFRKYYEGFVVLFIFFLFYLYLLTIFWNLGVQFRFIQALTPAFGVLYYFMGILCEHVERNWFIGIRTPWTLSNETVWKKTHRIGAKLFKICGVIAFLGMIFEKFAVYLIVPPVILLGVYATIYSYLEYKREIKT
jgi:uncharacterized membrane protein